MAKEKCVDRKKSLPEEPEINSPKLIRWIGTITTFATEEKFVPKDKFYKDSEEVKFCGFFGTFEEDFLAGNGKIEDPLDEQKLRYGNLVKQVRDLPKKGEDDISIIPELGGEARVETTLTEFYDILKKQGKGEKEGVLLTNGSANIFYIRNIEGSLRATVAFRFNDTWKIYSQSLGFPYKWNIGARVFSRNS